jgi:hypothetical protein
MTGIRARRRIIATGKSARQPLGDGASQNREESPGFTEQDAG